MKNDTDEMSVNLYKETVITAEKLAEFMGISTQTLRRMDSDGRLKALRRPSGRRYYTTAHLITALEIMGGARSRLAKTAFCKTGASSLTGKIPVPRKWLESIGITPECPDAELCFDGEKIIISKPVEQQD